MQMTAFPICGLEFKERKKLGQGLKYINEQSCNWDMPILTLSI